MGRTLLAPTLPVNDHFLELHLPGGLTGMVRAVSGGKKIEHRAAVRPGLLNAREGAAAGQHASREPVTAAAIGLAWAGPQMKSSSPATMRVGQVMRPSSGRRSTDW